MKRPRRAAVAVAAAVEVVRAAPEQRRRRAAVGKGFEMSHWETRHYLFEVGSSDILLFHLKEFLRSRPYLKNRPTRTSVFDASLQAALAEYQRYKRLRVADGTFNAETYAAIGGEMSAVQVGLISTGAPGFQYLLRGAASDGRALTSNEVSLAKEIFKSSLSYDAVKVHNGKYTRFQWENSGMTPNGEIYAHGTAYKDDYTADHTPAGLETKAFFIHEMAHVWQWQNNILRVKTSAILETLKHKFDYMEAYKYTLKADADLIEYGIEQQASIIEDYYRVIKRGLGFKENNQNQEPLPARKELLKKVMGNFVSDPSYAVR